MTADAFPNASLLRTTPLRETGDFAKRMVAGINAYLDRALSAADQQRNLAQVNADTSVAEKRAEFARIIGVVDARQPIDGLEFVGATAVPSLIATSPSYEVFAIRWPVLDGVDGEGLLLRPKAPPIAHVIAIPDADWSPETLVGLASGLDSGAQFARRLAELGCEVVVPVLIDRGDAWSGNPAIRMTNQPHREYIYRMAYEVGRHMIGYEVQKVLALVDFFASAPGNAPVAVYGYGEGGLLALHSGALDPRIGAVGVSGYFHDGRNVWQEPIYRDAWGLLRGFSDAELAALIAPHPLVIEASPGPTVDGPPPTREGRQGAAPGRLAPLSTVAVQAEVERARPIFRARGASDRLSLIVPKDGDTGPGTEPALRTFLRSLGVTVIDATPADPPKDLRAAFDPTPRLRRQFDQLVNHTQWLVRRSAAKRKAYWAEADTSSLEAWTRTCEPYRAHFWDEVIGRCPPPCASSNPRTRRVYDRPGWTGYEVVLDVLPDVFAYGLLLLPKDLRPGERRPVVVCQHGLEGRPQNVVENVEAAPYRGFGAQLVERGYVVYAPQNPYIGGDDFRVIQRKGHPLKLALFSFITAQHQQTLRWLSEQPFVDPQRIAFYGLSYGGKTAMRVPALLDGYCLSICSADFNEWIEKCASVDMPMSYMFSVEYDMYEFDLAHTCNYAEMAGLIAPRPFMVERGHRDGVGVDEWIAFEYAKVRHRYADLRIPDRTEITFFEGGHDIAGKATFTFLDRHLGWNPTT